MLKCFVHKTKFVKIKLPTGPMLRRECTNFPKRQALTYRLSVVLGYVLGHHLTVI
jgi:hypothetical protein